MSHDLCRGEKRREKEMNWVELQYVMASYVVGNNIKVKKTSQSNSLPKTLRQPLEHTDPECPRTLYFAASSFASLSLPVSRRADSSLWRDGGAWLGGAQSNHLLNMAS